MTIIKQILELKGHDCICVAPADTVYAAIEKMAKNSIGSVLVMEGARLVGIFTERDYARNVVLKGRSSPQTLVRDIMSTTVVCVEPEDAVETCMALMTRMRVRHLPVVEDGAVIGLVSIGDLVKSVIDEQEYTIEQLETYIRGELHMN